MEKEYFILSGKNNLYISKDKNGIVEDLKNPKNQLSNLEIISKDNYYSCNIEDYQIRKVSYDTIEELIRQEDELNEWGRFFDMTSKENPKFCFDEQGNLTTIDEMKNKKEILHKCF